MTNQTPAEPGSRVTGPIVVPPYFVDTLNRAETSWHEADTIAPIHEQYDYLGVVTLYTLTRTHLVGLLTHLYGAVDGSAIYEQMVRSGVSWDEAAVHLFDVRDRLAALEADEADVA